MKKILCILSLVFCSTIMWGQYHNYSCHTITAADTITIGPTDNIYGISISVPASATDSTIVIGNARTLSSGTVSQVEDGIKLAPGEYLNIGGDGNRLKYLYLIVKDEARIVCMTLNRL